MSTTRERAERWILRDETTSENACGYTRDSAIDSLTALLNDERMTAVTQIVLALRAGIGVRLPGDAVYGPHQDALDMAADEIAAMWADETKETKP